MWRNWSVAIRRLEGAQLDLTVESLALCKDLAASPVGVLRNLVKNASASVLSVAESAAGLVGEYVSDVCL